MTVSALVVDGMSRSTSEGPRFTSLDSRVKILNDTFDDLVVLCGLVVAGRASRELIANASENSGNVQAQIDRLARADGVAAEDWALLQQLWYRWRVPWGSASLYWWHLFCTALGRCSDAAQATDLFSQWVEKLDTPDVLDRGTVYETLTGIFTKAIGARIRYDISAIHCFVGAALKGAPLIKVFNDSELAAIEAAGVHVFVSDNRLSDAKV